MQYDLSGNFIKEWRSITAIVDFYGYKSPSNINFACRSKSGISHGFIWRFKDASRLEKEKKPYTSDHVLKTYQYSPLGTLMKMYSSTKIAEKDGFCASSIQRCIHGVMRKHKGFVWSNRPLSPEEVSKILQRKK